MPDTTTQEPAPSVLSQLFSYRGRINRAQYLTAVLICAGCIAVALFGLAQASNPKGGDAGLLLTFPLLILFIMIFPAAVVKRLRDAGWSRGAKFAFALVPILWVMVTIVFANHFQALIPLGAAALVLIPLMAGPVRHDPKPEA